MKKFIFLTTLGLFFLTGCSFQVKNIKIDSCDTTGNRIPNVVVDVGMDTEYASRDYYAYTNDFSQVYLVEAKEIILQNDEIEPVFDGRYCKDEAKVKGTEDKNLDEGHAIADSLGGVSNAYNITPQNSYQNRNGSQRDFENDITNTIKNGGSITNFKYEIFYSNKLTQTPTSYKVSYEKNNKIVELEFLNED